MYEVENATASKTVFISGQVAWDADGNVVGPGDLRAQFIQTYENLESLMAGARGGGARRGLDDIAQLRTSLTDRQLLGDFRSIRNELYPSLFPSGAYPTNTLLI